MLPNLTQCQRLMCRCGYQVFGYLALGIVADKIHPGRVRETFPLVTSLVSSLQAMDQV